MSISIIYNLTESILVLGEYKKIINASYGFEYNCIMIDTSDCRYTSITIYKVVVWKHFRNKKYNY